MEPILEVSDLKKSYDERNVLNDLSFSVGEGGVLVILGPSGHGKPTLLRCTNGLESIQSGVISFEGEEILNNPEELPLARQKIGMVFQSHDPFPHLTVLKSLLLALTKAQKHPRKRVGAEALGLLKRADLTGRENSFPHKLSGGQGQHVAIVRSSFLHPKVVLFDEMTTSLDPEMVRGVLELIGELASEGRAMIVVTRELQFAKAITDRIVFLENGHVVEENDVKAFFMQPKTQRARDFLNVLDFSTAG